MAKNNVVVYNDRGTGRSHRHTLSDLFHDATYAEIAVSYVQATGWDQLLPTLQHIVAKNIKMLVTDQFDITNPYAIRNAISHGAEVRYFKGRGVYHPKVYVAYDRKHRPLRALVGSSNLSSSGLEDGVEMSIVVLEKSALLQIASWIEELFQGRLSAPVNKKWIEDLETRRQGRIRQIIRASSGKYGKDHLPLSRSIESVLIQDEVIAHLNQTIAMLGFDQAGNNIRNLSHGLGVLTGSQPFTDKQRSEFHLLGFLDSDNALTTLGNRAITVSNEVEFATEWCRWVAHQPSALLSDRLNAFRQAATRFWQLPKDVRDFFFAHLEDEQERSRLIAIELLCNVDIPVGGFSLNCIESVIALLSQPSVPQAIQVRINDYLRNKGRRSWESGDRGCILQVWKEEILDKGIFP